MGDTNATSLFSDSRKLLASAKQGFGLVETQPTKLKTNLAAVSLPGGQMAVGVGLEDGTLRLWLPE
jgi:hypothetical protein